MALRIQPVQLDAAEDSEAVLIFRDDRLAAIVSRLGDLHDERAGHRFVEATFGEKPALPAWSDFTDLEDFEAWIIGRSRPAAG